MTSKQIEKLISDTETYTNNHIPDLKASEYQQMSTDIARTFSTASRLAKTAPDTLPWALAIERIMDNCCTEMPLNDLFRATHHYASFKVLDTLVRNGLIAIMKDDGEIVVCNS